MNLQTRPHIQVNSTYVNDTTFCKLSIPSIFCTKMFQGGQGCPGSSGGPSDPGGPDGPGGLGGPGDQL